MVYATSESAPEKTQNLPLTAVPSTTLTTSSGVPGLKNQKYPVSLVSGTAVAVPRVPWDGTLQETWTRKRLALTQRMPGSEEQGASCGSPPAGGAGSGAPRPGAGAEAPRSA